MSRKSVKPLVEEFEEVQENATPPALTTSDATPHSKKISKAGAARAALAEGIYVPKKASLYIKEKYGIDISPQQFSAEKSRLKHRSGEADQHLTSQRHDSSRFATHRNLTGEVNLLNALEVMKPLIDQLGVEKVKRMVELLG